MVPQGDKQIFHDTFSLVYYDSYSDNTPCPEKNAPPPKQNAVTCTVYNTIQ